MNIRPLPPWPGSDVNACDLSLKWLMNEASPNPHTGAYFNFPFFLQTCCCSSGAPVCQSLTLPPVRDGGAVFFKPRVSRKGGNILRGKTPFTYLQTWYADEAMSLAGQRETCAFLSPVDTCGPRDMVDGEAISPVVVWGGRGRETEGGRARAACVCVRAPSPVRSFVWWL